MEIDYKQLELDLIHLGQPKERNNDEIIRMASLFLRKEKNICLDHCSDENLIDKWISGEKLSFSNMIPSTGIINTVYYEIVKDGGPNERYTMKLENVYDSSSINSLKAYDEAVILLFNNIS